MSGKNIRTWRIVRRRGSDSVMMFKLSNAHYENFLYLCIFLNSNMPCSMDVNFAKPQLTLFFLSFSDAHCANSLINMLVRTSTLMLMYTEQILVTQSFSFCQRSIARQGLLRPGPGRSGLSLFSWWTKERCLSPERTAAKETMRLIAILTEWSNNPPIRMSAVVRRLPRATGSIAFGPCLPCQETLAAPAHLLRDNQLLI